MKKDDGRVCSTIVKTTKSISSSTTKITTTQSTKTLGTAKFTTKPISDSSFNFVCGTGERAPNNWMEQRCTLNGKDHYCASNPVQTNPEVKGWLLTTG